MTSARGRVDSPPTTTIAPPVAATPASASGRGSVPARAVSPVRGLCGHRRELRACGVLSTYQVEPSAECDQCPVGNSGWIEPIRFRVARDGSKERIAELVPPVVTPPTM